MVEGQLLLTTGKDITQFTVREIANIAYHLITSKFQPPSEDGEPSIEEQIELFDEKIGQKKSAEAKALEALRQNMIMRGIDPDVVPELGPELKAKLEADAAKMATDEDLMWGDGLYAGKEIRGKKVDPFDEEF